MPVVTFVEFDGSRHELNVAEGQNVMQAAVDHALSGIVGECCGSMACATCHCYVDEDWANKVSSPSDMEKDMLGCSPVELKPTSRLGCQITLSDALDGLVVHLPESQF